MGQQDGPPAHLATACPIIGEQNKSTLRPPSLSVLLWDDPKVLTLTRHHRTTSCASTGKKFITRSINNTSVRAGDGCLMRWLCRCLVIGGPFFESVFIQWALLLPVFFFFFCPSVCLSNIWELVGELHCPIGRYQKSSVFTLTAAASPFVGQL